MSLNLSVPTETVTALPVPGLRRLPKSMLPMILDYANAVAIKKEADAASDAAGNTIKAHKAKLLEAMDGSLSAICDQTVITRKDTKASEPTLTMRDGSKIKWADVTGLVVDGKKVPMSDVLKLYGGRDGSISLTVT